MPDYDGEGVIGGGAGGPDLAFDEVGVDATASASAGAAAASAAAAAAPPSNVVSGSVAVDSASAAPQALSAAVDATVAELLKELRRHADVARAEGRGFVDMVSAFCAAVAWRQEPWLWALALVHLAAAATAVRRRHSPAVLATLFAGGCAAVLLGERINAFAARHWRLFATQDYFDARGVFYSAVVGGPVLLNLVLVVAMYLLQCAALLAQAKAAQIKAARKRGGGGKAKGVAAAAAAAGTPARRRAAATPKKAAAAATGETPRPRTRSQAARKDE
jgi:hypothetical protein